VRICGLDAPAIRAALGEATRARLVERGDTDDYVFVHDRIQEALLAPLTPEAGRALHQRIANDLQKNPEKSAEYVYALARHAALGEVDAILLEGLALGGGRVIATSSDIRPGHECCALVASGKFLRDDPDAALRLVKAFAQGLKHAVANHDDVVEVVAKRDGLEPALAREALKNVRFKYPPFNDTADIAFVVQALMNADKIDKSQVRDVGAFVADAVDNRMIKSIAG